MKSVDSTVELRGVEPAFPGKKTIAVYGMGFVGLTLAVTFADAGFPVVGVERDTTIVAKLNQKKAAFYEKGLDDLLQSVADKNPMLISTSVGSFPADVHVISVGTPLGKDNKPDLGALSAITSDIARVLKQGDLVILRSTVPVGTTRGAVLPLLESSGLKAGEGFYLAFAPERTAEGKALEELKILPQIIGGVNEKSVEMTRQIFSSITKMIVEVGSLEAAELVKLMNNTFRDLVFSFANETAQICDALNIDAFQLIKSANEGYPRNTIPLPSPGVAGLCLSKDPYLYSYPAADVAYKPVLGFASRRINSQGADYVRTKLERFCQITGRKLPDLKILLVGLAFKGMPETSDCRHSVALELLKSLPSPKNISVKDFVVPSEDIRALGYQPAEDFAEAIGAADAILVMNNHYRNNQVDAVSALKNAKRPVLFFDGWHMFDRQAVESLEGVLYATMGYMTANKNRL